MIPQLSIITPVKDQEKYIRECILSTQLQSFTNWEWIIVDDHSQDQTIEIIREYQAIDSRIKLLKNKERGIVSALQLAYSHSKSEFITRFDGDDIMPEKRLELMFQAIQQEEPKTVVTGKVKYFSDSTISEGYQAYEKWLNQRIANQDHWKWVYRECVVASPNWMVSKKDLESINAFEDLVYPEDYHLVLKWFANGFKVKGISEVTLNWREHSERTSRNSENYDQKHFFELKLNHLINSIGDSKTIVLWGSNPKAQLTAHILKEHKMEFLWMDLIEEPQIRGNDHILPYKRLEKHQNILLLLAVYPPEEEKNKLESYLDSLGLFLGEHYWYL